MERSVQQIVPTLPGVYFFKDTDDKIIYIGKAKNLRHRVNSYFQNRKDDWKVGAIMGAYHSLDFIITKNETEAMLLEADLIQRYQPPLNTIFKEGQPFMYILFTDGELPHIKIVRNKKQKGIYFGPFLHKAQARNVHRFLLNTFRLNICNKNLENGCLDYHLGTCPGTCKKEFDARDYLFRLTLAQDLLRQKSDAFITRIKTQVKSYNKKLAFEKSKHLHTYLENVETIFQTIKTNYSPKKFKTDIFVATTPSPLPKSKESAHDVGKLLGVTQTVRTIDCFDISHFQSRYIVGACVRFTNGIPDKNMFRRFRVKTITEQNDYAALQEIVSRRYRDSALPDLILIDGGKGQLSAIKELFPNAHIASIAKREERLFHANYTEGIVLNIKNSTDRLLIALRDYTHHFAISYHRLRRHKNLIA